MGKGKGSGCGEVVGKGGVMADSKWPAGSTNFTVVGRANIQQLLLFSLLLLCIYKLKQNSVVLSEELDEQGGSSDCTQCYRTSSLATRPLCPTSQRYFSCWSKCCQSLLKMNQ